MDNIQLDKDSQDSKKETKPPKGGSSSMQERSENPVLYLELKIPVIVLLMKSSRIKYVGEEKSMQFAVEQKPGS